MNNVTAWIITMGAIAVFGYWLCDCFLKRKKYQGLFHDVLGGKPLSHKKLMKIKKGNMWLREIYKPRKSLQKSEKLGWKIVHRSEEVNPVRKLKDELYEYIKLKIEAFNVDKIKCKCGSNELEVIDPDIVCKSCGCKYDVVCSVLANKLIESKGVKL